MSSILKKKEDKQCYLLFLQRKIYIKKAKLVGKSISVTVPLNKLGKK
jgi:hypothetical protein